MQIKQSNRTRTIANAAISAILSWLMVFNGLPMQAIADEIMDGGQDAAVEVLDEEAAPEGEQEQVPASDDDADDDPIEEIDSNIVTEAVPDAEAEPGPELETDASFIAAETDDEDEEDAPVAVVVQGDAALSEEAAVEALEELDNVSHDDAVEMGGLLFAMADDASRSRGETPEEIEAHRKADGSFIDRIEVKWITKDTVDNDDPALLYVRPSGDNEQSVRMQVNYSLSGEHNYEPGDIVITVPAFIFKDRTAANTPDAPANYGAMVIPYPENPSTKGDFNWVLTTDDDGNEVYQLTNTKRMQAASRGYIQFGIYELTPHTLVDMLESEPFSAKIEVITHAGNLIWLDSNEITAQFDTEAQVTSASKRVYGAAEIVGAPDNVPAAIAEQFPGEENFVRVDWYAWAYRESNTMYRMDVNDIMSTKADVNGEADAMDVVGFIVGATDADGHEVSKPNAISGYVDGTTSYYNYTTYYPLSQFDPDVEYTLKNDTTFTLTEVDPERGDDPQLVTEKTGHAETVFSWSNPEWIDPSGHYMVAKNGNDDHEQLGVAKGNQTHRLGSTRSDVHIWSRLNPINGWYGVYPSGLNQLQDIAADEEAAENEGIRLSYTIDSVGYVMPWMFDSSTWAVDHENATRRSVNYTLPITMTTVDTGISIGRNGEKLTVGEDYDLVSVEFPADPWIYLGEPHNINPDGSFEAITAGDGTFLYSRDNNKTHWPEIALQIQRDGSDEWEDFATASWSSGSFQATLADGSTQSDRVIDLPEDAANFRTVVTLQNTATDAAGAQANRALQAAIDYDVRVVVNLRATDDMIALIEDAFTKSNVPTILIYNGTTMTVNRGTAQNLGAEVVSIDKDGYDQVRGYTTDTKVVPTKTSARVSQTRDVNVEARTVTLHYSAKVEEQSFINDRATYEQAIEDGRLTPTTHGVWRDLLPRGVNPIVGSVKLRDGDTVTSAYTIPDYEQTGRTMLVVEADFTPVPQQYWSDEDSINYWEDVPSISFDATIGFDELKDYGGESDTPRLHNVISFESANDHLGTIEGYRGEPDSPAGNNVATTARNTFADDAEKAAMTDLNPDRDDSSFLYAGTWTEVDILSAARLGLRKEVMVNNDGEWSTGVYNGDENGQPYADAADAREREQELQDGGDKRTVYAGGVYSYRLRMVSSDDSITSNLILFDSLETFEPVEGNDKIDGIDIGAPTWHGTFTGVDVSQLAERGCAPVVYYSEQELSFYSEEEGGEIVQNTANTDLTNTDIWTEASAYEAAHDGDVSRVRSVAIDARKKAGGGSFEIQPLDTIVVLINMRAPSGIEAAGYIENDAHAYNGVAFQSTVRDINGYGESTDFNHQEYTKVGLKEYEIPVEKTWDDDDDRDGIRPESVTFELYANGKPALDEEGNPITIEVSADEEGNWNGVFQHIPYTDEDGVAIRYSVRERLSEGYSATSQLDGNTYAFTNAHEPERTQVPVTKTWENDSPENRPAYVTYVLRGSDGSIKRQVVRPDASGSWDYTFTNLYKYTDHGQPIEYTVEEILPTGDSHSASYEAPVIEGDNNGFSITNPYHPYGDLSVSKTVSNVTEVSAETEFTFTFSFTTVGEDGEQVPVRGDFAYDILDSETGEVLSSGTVACDGTVTIKGGQTIHVKELPEKIHYEVTESDEGGFTLSFSSGAVGSVKPNVVTTASFQNDYHATGRFQASAFKTLYGRKLNQYQFRFRLADTDGNTLRTATSGRPTTSYIDGSTTAVDYSTAVATFGAITYTQADLDGAASKTFTYTVSEIKTDREGYTYDETVYTVDVTVTDKGDGTLEVVPAYKDAEGNPISWESDSGLAITTPHFENEYHAEGEITLKAWKDLVGRDLAEGEFTFELFDESGRSLGTAANNGDGSVTFSPEAIEALNFDETDIGETYYFGVSEVAGSDPTVNYDDSVHGYVVTVFDNGDGTLSFTQGVASPIWGVPEECEVCHGQNSSYTYGPVNGMMVLQQAQEPFMTFVNSLAAEGITPVNGQPVTIDGGYTTVLNAFNALLTAVGAGVQAKDTDTIFYIQTMGTGTIPDVKFGFYCTACGGNNGVCPLCGGAGETSPSFREGGGNPYANPGAPMITSYPANTYQEFLAYNPGFKTVQIYARICELEGSEITVGNEQPASWYQNSYMHWRNQFDILGMPYSMDVRVPHAEFSGVDAQLAQLFGLPEDTNTRYVVNMVWAGGFAHGAGSASYTIEATTDAIVPCPKCGGTGTVEVIIGWTTEEAEPPVFTNTLKPGGFSVTKIVENPESADPTQEFTFHVRLIGDEVTDETVTEYTITQASATGDTGNDSDGSGNGGNGTGGSTSGYIHPFSIRDLAMSSMVSGGLLALEGIAPMAGNSQVFHATDEQLRGTAYAVLTDTGELVFFRSTESYSDGADQTVTDIAGNSYTGHVYTGIEELAATGESQVPWYAERNSITAVRVASGQAIKPISCAYWFNYGLSGTQLSSFDATGFDTSNVTNMSSMFHNCSKLTSLDLSSFDTSNVTNMSSMFYFANWNSALTSLDISNFDTSNVTTMNSMFFGSAKLASLDLRSFDTGNVTDMSSMFYGCKALTSLNLTNFNTSNVTSMSQMFQGLSSITEFDISTFDTSNVKSMYNMFNGFGTLSYALDLTNFDTSNVTDMSSMFCNCRCASVDLSSFDTSNVTSMGSMFYGSALRTIDVSSFDTSKVTYMGRMFEQLYNVTTLDLSNFDTRNVTSMRRMFWGSQKLTSIDVSSFDTSKVTDMEAMFYNCNSLTTLDVHNFDTGNVTNMDHMFLRCSGLTSLNVSGFSNTKVKNFNSMFDSCSSLTRLDLSDFGTPSATSMEDMFYGCSSLEWLDISGFDTSNIVRVADTRDMFTKASRLSTVVLGEGYGVDKIELATPPSDAPYTGKWVREDHSYGPLTPVELRNRFTTDMAGTWVWERIPVDYTVIYTAETGVGGTMASSTFQASEDAQLPANRFYKPGYTFDHWNVVTVNDVAPSTEVNYSDGASIPGNTYQIDDVVLLQAVFVPRDTSVEMHDGEFTFTLLGGETAHFDDIPAGTAYQVWEETPEGWVLVSQSGTSGVIAPLEEAEATFTNRYQPGTAQVQFNGTKTLDGRASDADAFSFELEAVTEGAPMPETTTVSTLAGGFIQFPPLTFDEDDLGDEESKTFTYTISEVDSGNNAIDYDNHVETIEVTVEKTGPGKIKATVAYENGSSFSFANTTRPGMLTVTKEAETTEANADDVFTFKITLTNDKGIPLDEDIEWYVRNEDGTPAVPENQPEPDAPQTGSRIRTPHLFANRIPLFSGLLRKSAGLDSDGHFHVSDDDPMMAGAAYAILTSKGDLIFFRSTTPIATGSGKTVTINGTTYTNCYVYGGFENLGSVSGRSNPWINQLSQIKTVSIAEGYAIKPRSMYQWFCSSGNSVNNITSVDLSRCDTSRVTSMYWLFKGSKVLEELDVSTFDTGNVTSMSGMFAGCEKLTHIDVSHFVTSKVTSFSTMFAGCSALESIDASSFDTSSVTSMSWMFSQCSSLKSLDVSNFDTSKVSSMFGMFSNCSSLVELDLSSFHTGSLTDTYNLFFGLTNLEMLNIENFDMRNVTSANYMFNVPNLRWIRLGPNWRFKNGNQLNTPPSGTTTGKWMNEDDPSVGSYTPYDLTYDAYNSNSSAMAGTWVWEAAPGTGIIHYVGNGGTVLVGDYVGTSEDEAVVLPDDSAVRRQKYVLSAWTENSDGSGASYEPGSSVTGLVRMGALRMLFAQWEESTLRAYTVRYYQQNASLDGYELVETEGWAAGKRAAYGTEVTPEPKKYDGFVTPAAQTVTVAEDESTTVDYYYDRVQYNVHFEGNGADSGAMADLSMVASKPADLPRNMFHKSGSLFTGWNTEADGSGTTYLDGQEISNLTSENGAVVTLYAQWLDNENEALEPTQGEVIVQCKAGQTIVLPDLPAGTHFVVEEIDLPDGWKQTGSVNEDGTIVANEISAATISNAYSSTGELALIAHKALAGGELQEGMFSFTLTNASGNPHTVNETVLNGAVDIQETIVDEDGNERQNPWYGTAVVEFSPIAFTQDDIGKTFTFYIVEKYASEEGFLYDTHTEQVAVTVKDAGHGLLDFDVEYDSDGALFTNMQVVTHPGTLSVTKNVEPGSPNQEFEFVINLIGPDGKPLKGEYPALVIAEQAKVTTGYIHTPNVNDSGEKQYDLDSMNYGSIYTFDGANLLKVDLTYMSPRGQFCIFNGEFNQVNTGQWDEQCNPNTAVRRYPYSGTTTELSYDSFIVEGDSLSVFYQCYMFQPNFTGYNEWSNYGYYGVVTAFSGDYETVSFSSGDSISIKGGGYFEINGLPAGTTYTVTEVPTSGWTQVSPDGAATGTIAADETAAVAFVNSYDALGALELKAEKTYEGGTLAANQFQFGLYDANGGQIEVVGNKADGTVAFSPIGYTMEDLDTEFTYTVRELIPENAEDGVADGVTYDGTVYTVTVTPEDDGNGGIVAEPVIEKDGSAVEKMIFSNSYEGRGEIPLTATKILEGREFKSGDTWTFTVADEAGKTVIEKTMEFSEGSEQGFELGTVRFTLDDLGGAQVKDFTYTVSESGTVAGVENDPDAERTITVRVTDNGDGRLSVKLLDGSDELVWTNTYVPPETVRVPVEKVWEDSGDAEGVRPASVTVRLLADGNDTGEALVLSEENGWKGAFEGLEDGPAYTVSEDDVEGYSTAISGDASKGFTVTNTREIVIPETVDISGSKTWDDADDQDGVRPESITVRLLADGEEVASVTVTAEDGWAWSFTGLPKLSDGSEISYTVTEDAVDGYSATYSGYDVTNSRTPDETSVTVVKVWDDEGDKDGVRPASVTVRLIADGEDTGERLVLSEANGWKGSFAGLPVNGTGGERISYTVAEDPVEGYSSSVSGDAARGFTVTNAHSPEEETPPPPPTPEIPDTGDAATAAWPLLLAGAAALIAARRLRRRED